MFKIALVVCRECLEIAIFLGIIAAITSQVKKSKTYIIMGCIIGMVVASIMAFLVRYISVSFSGLGDEIFNVCAIFLTVMIISWTIVWMKGQSIKLKEDINNLSVKINQGTASHFLLASLVAMTIFREVTEIILFVYSIASSESLSPDSYIIGLGVGIFAGFLIGFGIYVGLIRFAGRYIFKISSFLLTVIAAGLSAQAAGILNSTGIVMALSNDIWDSSWLVSDYSVLGKFLNIAVGYISRPTELQAALYFATIAYILLLLKVRGNGVANNASKKLKG